MSKCIFCEKELKAEDGGSHHLIPIVVRNMMNWHTKRGESTTLNYRVPICRECHVKLNLLEEPLVKIIKYLRTSPPIPIEFAYKMEDICDKLNGDEKEEERP